MRVIHVWVRMTFSNYEILKKIKEDFICLFDYNHTYFNEEISELSITCASHDEKAILKRLSKLDYSNEERG